MVRYFKDLEFNLPSALLNQLTALFEEMVPGPLTNAALKWVPEEQGVYQLFFKNKLVYVGKTDADAGLRNRLLRHSKKIRSRLNLNPRDVKFKAVRVYVFTAMDLEDWLIKYYKDVDGDLEWNLSGFGANDPGRNRDKSEVKEDHFDNKYPIDLGLSVEVDQGDDRSVANVLRQLKNQLEYTIRFERAGKNSKKAHPELEATHISLKSRRDAVSEILVQIAQAMGAEWQITALSGYVIIYKENEKYPGGRIIR
ncbi:GIY-YIG nuclease family protein [Burkholderia territorii]|uniref:GIY-YIG nuclease family protein n=1 Tax=Burkholderia territorii TaxID=1503055 RepID=UPI0012DA1C6E|nr:GIY-YIG nuclease family protein [Burkholderia territorii]